MEACEIEMRGNDIDVGACSLATTALPITAVLPPSPAYAEIVAAITSEMRTGVAACGTRHQVVGTVEVVVTVNYAGRLIAVAPRTGSRAFADCTGSALSSARFPRSRQGGTTPIPFELASPTP
jgi:ABC-type Fe3+-hydroxamate transport system substrate-binding protein